MSSRARRGWGEGRLVQMPSGKWRAIISIGIIAGKRARKSQSFATKNEAVAWLAKHKLMTRLSGAVAWTVGSWCQHWLDTIRRDREYQTWRFYRQRVRLFIEPYLGSIRMDKLDKVRLDRWHAELASAGVTLGQQNRAAKTLRAALEAARRANVVPENVARRAPLPRARPGEMGCWTLEQARVFLESEGNDPEWGAAWWLLLDAGLRPAELLALYWPDFDVLRGLIRVQRALVHTDRGYCLKQPKTRKGIRTIPLSEQTVARLLAHREYQEQLGRDTQSGLMFPAPRGGYLRPVYLGSRFFKKAVQRVQRTSHIPTIRVYDLRHTCATLLLGAGVNVRVVAERLGHEDPALTLRVYAHAMPSMQEEARRTMTNLLSGEYGTRLAHETRSLSVSLTAAIERCEARDSARGLAYPR